MRFRIEKLRRDHRVEARLRHADSRQECLLVGVDRKRLGHHQTDAIDPQRTFVTFRIGGIICHTNDAKLTDDSW